MLTQICTHTQPRILKHYFCCVKQPQGYFYSNRVLIKVGLHAMPLLSFEFSLFFLLSKYCPLGIAISFFSKLACMLQFLRHRTFAHRSTLDNKGDISSASKVWKRAVVVSLFEREACVPRLSHHQTLTTPIPLSPLGVYRDRNLCKKPLIFVTSFSYCMSAIQCKK